MIICPVCEHQQPPAAECAVCGRLLAARPAVDATPQRMPELEGTRYPRVPVAPASLPELESTRLPAAAAAPAAPLPDLEPSRAGVGDVSVAPMPEMDTGRFVDASERTPPPTGALTCRYCRNVQATGLFCDRCGMRLPRYQAAAPVAGNVRAEDAPMVPHACGAITRAGMPCGSCGVFVALPSE